MLDQVQQGHCCLDGALREALELAGRALDGAVASVTYDAEAAYDEIIAARLLVSTALVRLNHEVS